MKKEYIALELEKELLNTEILRDELMDILKSRDISWQCFKKYVKVERLEKEELIELSLEEVVQLLNECSQWGENYNSESYEYRVVDGKPYVVIRHSYIKVL